MTNPLRVLMVEDSEADAELILRELTRGGYAVTSERVQTEAAMAEALSRRVWDLVLSDYSMPQFSSSGAMATLKASGLDLPLIIASGTIGEEIAVAALHAGAGDFVLKSKLSRLIPAIERELRECQVRAARERAEVALRESEARYRRIIETTNEGVWLLDADSKTTFVNGRMGTLLGYHPDELMARPVFDFVHDESHSALVQNLGRRQRENAGSQIEARLRRKDGADLWVLFDSTPIFEAEDCYVGALAMVTDVSQRRQLEEQLRQAQKIEAIGSLASGVAHDFNNLLTVILSYTSMIVDGLGPDDPIRADLVEVHKAGERAKGLTQQLLAFSRQQLLEPRTLDLNQVIVGLERMLRPLLGASVEMSLLNSQTLGKVYADLGQIEQIVMNLVVNARDAMPDGGKVTIETCNVDLDAAYAALHHDVTPGPYVMFAVTDTGSGMSAATQARIFEPFFSTKDPGTGTGLGLSTVFGIVKQSGGHIWVYSEPGVGTTFKVYLPQTGGAPRLATAPPPPPLTLRGGETILLVEDEEQVRTAVRMILQRHGYNVLEAQNGGEAFLICEKYTAKIELLLTDVVLPRMSGRALAERVLPTRPEMKVLYVSGYTGRAVVNNGVLESGIHFLQKPITPDALARKVREVLDGGPATTVTALPN